MLVQSGQTERLLYRFTFGLQAFNRQEGSGEWGVGNWGMRRYGWSSPFSTPYSQFPSWQSNPATTFSKIAQEFSIPARYPLASNASQQSVAKGE